MKQNGKYMLHVLLTTFICLALVSAGALIISMAEYYREQQEIEELSSIVSIEETTTNLEEIQPVGNSPSNQSNIEEKYDVVSIPQILPQYAALQLENPDLFGWIRIEGTVVDYPVMYSPNNPEFYLNHAFDLTESQSGIPFLDANCTNDGFIYLLYGHHLKNGSMFAAITKYADADFFEQHPIIKFDTLYEEGQYQVFAAFYSRVYYTNEKNVFRFYQYTDLSDPTLFNEYLEQVKAASLYETDMEISYGDTLLTLTTCNYHTENGRFVVVAKKLD